MQIGPVSKVYKDTECKYATVNAVWEAKYHFDQMPFSDDEFQREKILFSVYNRNHFQANRLIGSFEFSLSNIHRQRNHQYYRKWVPLAIPDNPDINQGFLLVTIYVLGEIAKDAYGQIELSEITPGNEAINLDKKEQKTLVNPNMDDRKPYVLNCVVYKAANLLSTHEDSANIQAFAAVRFNGNVALTNNVASSSEPVWNRRMEMPFHLPLTSDNVEVQVWNYKRGRPDVLVGSETFNYFQLGLTHKAWGPRWVNLYSNRFASKQTSVLGNLKDYFVSPESNTAHEYIGRLLLRMSVTSKDDGDEPPRLAIDASNPTTDPPGDEFSVYFYLYSGSEIPVMGGEVCVEVVFGNER
jgi:hypothetical protein